MGYEQLLKAYENATNTHCFDEVSKLVTDDMTWVCMQHYYKGKEEGRRYFEGTWAVVRDEVYTIENVEWIAVSDTVAVCQYQYRWRGTVDGEVKEGRGRGTNVCVKMGEEWKMAHEHLTPLP